MFSTFRKNPSFLSIFAAMCLAALTQIVLLILFLNIDFISWWHFALLIIPLIAILPLIYLNMMIPLKSLTHLLVNQTLPDLKTVAQKGGDLGKLAEVVCGLADKNIRLQSRLSDLQRAYLNHCQQIDNLVNWLPIATFTISNKCFICSCNKKALSILGYDSQSQLISYRFSELLSDNDRQKIESILEGSHSTPVLESTMLRKDGTGLPVRMFILPDSNKQTKENRFFIFLSDGSEDKTNDMIFGKQGTYIYNIESVGRLAGGVAHDFNNILGAVSGYAEIIRNRYSSDEKLNKYSKMILSASRRGSALTEKLLQFARKNKLVLSLFDINDSLQFLKEMFNESQMPLEIRFQLNAEDCCILGDLEQFKNAITNIAVNAHEAMPEGGELAITTENITIDERTSSSHLFTITPGCYVAIRISDSGTGITHQDLSHLFEPFYTSKDRSQNAGLGLACVYGIVKSHNGFIDVESEAGKGTTFILYFPVCNEQYQQTTEKIVLNKSILLVDDEQIIREAIGETLSWLGFSVTFAESGDEAIEKLQVSSQSYDLVILDMIMPGMNGKECFTRIRELRSDIKVLISTGFSEDMNQEELLKMGVCGILVKPFESAQLTRAIYDALK